MPHKEQYFCRGDVGIHVTDAYGNTAQLESNALSVTVSELTISAVSADKAWVKIGDTVTWTTTATGGVKPLRYAFDIYVDGEELDGCAFTTNNTISYAPEMSGVYSVNALVRDAENTTVEMIGGEVTAYPQAPVLDLMPWDERIQEMFSGSGVEH